EASNQARHAASERNLSSRPGSVQSFMTTIYRTPPAHQNPVRQGNNSGGSYVAGLATAPAADEELVLYALDTSRTITLKIALANHPKFRLLPSVRRRLLDSMERSITHGAQHHPGVACYVPGP